MCMYFYYLYIYTGNKFKLPDYIGVIWFDLAIYKDEYDITGLESELHIWYNHIFKHKLRTIKLIQKHFQDYPGFKKAFPNITILLTIFLTVPLSSAECERSFSVLKRLKTWLRTTMGQDRLSSLALIQINPEILDSLDRKYLVEKFASTKERRATFF